MTASRRGLAHVTMSGGHRAEYLALFCRLFDLNESISRIDRPLMHRLVQAPQVLFASLDDDVRGFIGVALRRTIAGRKTCAIFVRPQSCFSPGLRGWTKKALFACLSRLPGLTILSIVPYMLDPRLTAVTSDWIYDPQMWDCVDAGSLPQSALSEEIADRARGRRVLAFLGRASAIKGFHFLAKLWNGSLQLRESHLVAVCGKVDADCYSALNLMRANGALVADRFLTETEMASVYGVSNLIWCCYESAYDQASGIFGRSLQFGRVPLVRAGAVVARYAQLTRATMIELSSGASLRTVIDTLVSGSVASTPNVVDRRQLRYWKTWSINQIGKGLGVELSSLPSQDA